MIRRAKISDSLAVSNIAEKDLGYKASPELVEYRIKNLDNSREAVLLEEIDGAVAGFIHIEKYEPVYSESLVNVLGLAVSSDYRRMGVGTRLIKSAEDWAEEHGISQIRLNSGMHRPEAHIFYRSIGFDNERDQKRFLKTIK